MWILIRKWGIILLALVVAGLSFLKWSGKTAADQIPDEKPQSSVKEFASPPLFKKTMEIQAAMERFADHRIDALLITIPQGEQPGKIAEKYFLKWKIGKTRAERGILIVLNQGESAFQVSQNLRRLFSEEFIETIRRKILHPAMKDGFVDNALVYVLFEFHKRLNATPEQIEEWDNYLKTQTEKTKFDLAAWLELQQPIEDVSDAWKRLIKHLSSNSLLDSFLLLKTGRIVFRNHLPKKQNELYRSFRNTEIKIVEKNGMAVVLPSLSGRIMTPFFFVKSADEWRFDAVSTERFVHQTQSESDYSNWTIRVYGNPYGRLVLSSGISANIAYLPFYSSCDFDPFEDDAVYRTIMELEKSEQASPLELARLLTMTGGPVDEIELQCRKAMKADFYNPAPYLCLVMACIEDGTRKNIEKAREVLDRMFSIPGLRLDESDAVTAGNFMACVSGYIGTADEMIHYADYVLGIRPNCYAYFAKIMGLERKRRDASPIMQAGYGENIEELRGRMRHCE